MTLVDTHTHIYDSDFAGRMLLVSTFLGQKNPLYDGDKDGVEQVLVIAKQHNNTYAIVGIYPEFAHNLDIDRAINSLRDIIQSNRKKAKAVGEIGLDYHCKPAEAAINAQHKLFRAQLKLADELNLPVSLHIRDTCNHDDTDAFSDAFKILAEFPKTRGVCHSFTGNRKSLDKALKLGFYISVNGIYTFNKDAELQATLDSIPLNRLLLETDAPFLTPAPNRAKSNKSSFLPDLAEFVAKSRKITLAEVAIATTQNAEKLFAI